jgi:hypothetical protein
MKEEGLKVAARALVEPDVRIVAGQFRSDAAFRRDEGPTALEWRFGFLLLLLDLRRFYVSEVLDGGGPLPHILYLQSGKMIAGGGYHTDMIADDSLRILAIRKATRLFEPPKVMADNTFEITARAAALGDKVPPQEMFKELRVTEWLNEETWYELYEGRAGWRVEGKAPELRMPPGLSEKQQEAIRQQQDKAKAGFFTQRLSLWTLPEGFTADIKRLTKAFRSGEIPRQANVREAASDARQTGKAVELQTEEGRTVLQELMKP